jgi:Erg28 like protein
MATYALALLHFSSEWLVFKTLRPNSTNWYTFAVASGTLVAMGAQYGQYVG